MAQPTDLVVQAETECIIVESRMDVVVLVVDGTRVATTGETTPTIEVAGGMAIVDVDSLVLTIS